MQELQWKDFIEYADDKGLNFSIVRESPIYAYLIMVDGQVSYKCRVSKEHIGYEIAKMRQSAEPFSIDVKVKDK